MGAGGERLCFCVKELWTETQQKKLAVTRETGVGGGGCAPGEGRGCIFSMCLSFPLDV